MSFRNPLGRARGLGSANEGTGHWMAQRISAVALIPLTLWFTVSMLHMTRAGYPAVSHWLHTPWVAVLLVLLVGSTFYHACLGLQVVIEDYVHDTWLKMSMLMLIRFAGILCAATGIFVVLRAAFGG
ncbi:MAG: succinate dehydrogenase, hydrophobic membrane anchor protein [Gammaproteobacteria bacterium]|nr:succinate dehydrogenase, hydrophobic membrane anchor protein [Gammaproteobacteria bacterium]